MKSKGLLDAMAEDAKRRVDAIRSEAQHKADAIVEEARHEAVERAEDARESFRAQHVQQEVEQKARAHAQVEREDNAIRLTIIEETLALAKREIETMIGAPEFDGVIDALLDEAVGLIEKPATVLVPVPHAERCRRRLEEHPAAPIHVEATADLDDGVVVENRQRTIRVTNTLSERFERALPEARKRCLARLFQDDAGPAAREESE